MARPVTIFTGQWADLKLEELTPIMADFGYDGLELACWGDHMDVSKASADKDYCKKQKAILEKHNLKLFAISNHLAGQLVCDRTMTVVRTCSPVRLCRQCGEKTGLGRRDNEEDAQAAGIWALR